MASDEQFDSATCVLDYGPDQWWVHLEMWRKGTDDFVWMALTPDEAEHLAGELRKEAAAARQRAKEPPPMPTDSA